MPTIYEKIVIMRIGLILFMSLYRENVYPLLHDQKRAKSNQIQTHCFVKLDRTICLKRSLRARQLIEGGNVALHSHLDCTGKAFEDRFDLVVLILAFGFDIQVAFGSVRK